MRKLLKIPFFLVFVTVFTSCEKTYDWSPSECAPKHYPAKILSNNFKYKNGGGVGTLQRTAGGMGWGNVGAGYAVGERLKPVPDSLLVNWFSVTQRKFYKGRFKLDSKAIEKELKQGKSSYLYTCFAPHGRVVVYVSGDHGKVPVQRLRAQEDTSMTVDKHILKINNVKTEEEFEEKYGEKLDGSNYLKHYIKKEDSIYIAKHGIPDKW